MAQGSAAAGRVGPGTVVVAPRQGACVEGGLEDLGDDEHEEEGEPQASDHGVESPSTTVLSRKPCSWLFTNSFSEGFAKAVCWLFAWAAFSRM